MIILVVGLFVALFVATARLKWLRLAEHRHRWWRLWLAVWVGALALGLAGLVVAPAVLVVAWPFIGGGCFAVELKRRLELLAVRDWERQRLEAVIARDEARVSLEALQLGGADSAALFAARRVRDDADLRVRQAQITLAKMRGESLRDALREAAAEPVAAVTPPTPTQVEAEVEFRERQRRTAPNWPVPPEVERLLASKEAETAAGDIVEIRDWNGTVIERHVRVDRAEGYGEWLRLDGSAEGRR